MDNRVEKREAGHNIPKAPQTSPFRSSILVMCLRYSIAFENWSLLRRIWEMASMAGTEYGL